MLALKYDNDTEIFQNIQSTGIHEIYIYNMTGCDVTFTRTKLGLWYK